MEDLQKCTRCNLLRPESSNQYYIRIKNSYEAPFICFQCLRIHKALNSESLEAERKERIQKYWEERKRKEYEKYPHRKRFQDDFADLVKRANENPDIQNQINENKIKKRNKDKEYFKTEYGKAINKTNCSKRRERVYASKKDIPDDEMKKVRMFYSNCPPGHHVDHIIPISLGGKHILNNLQYLPIIENMKKSHKIVRDYIVKALNGKPITMRNLVKFFSLDESDAEKVLDKIRQS